jgi:copper(I)-binding protein
MRPIFAAMLLCLTVFATAATARPPGVQARGAWIQATPPGATTAAGYVTLTNTGPVTDRLMGAHSAAAAQVVPHHMSMAGGIMRMRPITGGLPIAADATVKLAPGGDHLMLIGLKGPLVAGRHVKVTLDFVQAGPVVVDFPVLAGPPGGGMGGMHM